MLVAIHPLMTRWPVFGALSRQVLASSAGIVLSRSGQGKEIEKQAATALLISQPFSVENVYIHLLIRRSKKSKVLI